MATALSEVQSTQGRPSLSPYLAVGLGWFALLMLALRTPLIEPVFWWAFTHGLLVERLKLGPWGSRLLLLAAYLIVAIVGWAIVEMPPRSPKGVWRRAFVTWLAAEGLYCAAVAVLVRVGVLYE